uniref:Uncharacterized protein n=1 Tax=Anguilla anguilla TaxID=7936 RepID=A0A0E9V9C1_ANGAN
MYLKQIHSMPNQNNYFAYSVIYFI